MQTSMLALPGHPPSCANTPAPLSAHLLVGGVHLRRAAIHKPLHQLQAAGAACRVQQGALVLVLSLQPAVLRWK